MLKCVMSPFIRAHSCRITKTLWKKIPTNLQAEHNKLRRNETTQFVTGPVDNQERWHITLGPPSGA